MQNLDCLNQVAEFHRTFKHPILDTPQIPSKQRSDLRVSLIAEELKELQEAIENNDIVEVADALADIQYVLSGAILEFGLGEKFRELFDEVQRSNMSKACHTVEEAEETVKYYAAEKGTVAYYKEIDGKFLVYRQEDHKTLKNIYYSPADLKKYFNPHRSDGRPLKGNFLFSTAIKNIIMSKKHNSPLGAGAYFLRYVLVDTQSDPNSKSNPSTEKQKDLSRILVQELLDMGISDAYLDEWGYVYATIHTNSTKNVPTICFCSHVDTSPDCSGVGVKPLVHFNWDGSDIVLPDDTSQIIKVSEHPDLKNQIGNDIITASGTTLLGADNKAGVAEIMAAAHYLMHNPKIKHGTIKILFTPDEEVGRGTEKVDLKKLAADFGYTMDGESLGTLEDETFSADAVSLTIHGVSTHPGFAKGKLENAMKIAGNILAALPKDSLSPETTENMEGFIHPTQISGIQESVKLDFIIRDFTVAGLHEKENFVQNIVNQALTHYPNSSVDFKVIEQYRNMKEVLVNYPHVVDYALEAIKRAGLTPERRSIRGGTDGSRLSFMGLPCPNIFAGEHAFHSKLEWVSVQDMEKATEVIINLVQIWEENAD